jgi:hypothetical protein
MRYIVITGFTPMEKSSNFKIYNFNSLDDFRISVILAFDFSVRNSDK